MLSDSVHLWQPLGGAPIACLPAAMQVFRIKDVAFSGIRPLDISEEDLEAAAADRPAEHED